MRAEARLRAAIEAAPYCRPKLSVTAMIGGKDFATALERAIERSGKAGRPESMHADDKQPTDMPDL